MAHTDSIFSLLFGLAAVQINNSDFIITINQLYLQYSSSVTSRVLASNSRGAHEFRVSDSCQRALCVIREPLIF